MHQKSGSIAWPRRICSILLWTVIVVGISSVSRGVTSVPENAAAFDLKEMALFDAPQSIRQRFGFCVYCICRNEPDDEVRQYPTLKSDKPLYGSFQIGGSPAEPESGFHYAFAIDESSGADKGYDRFYIDANRNGDLTDDSPAKPVENVPEDLQVRSNSVTAQAFFEPVKLQVMPQDGPEQRLELMPRFFAYGEQRSYAALVPMEVYTGTIQIGEKELNAVLGHALGIPGWYDHPDTVLFIQSTDQPDDSDYESMALKRLHQMGETCYRVSAAPSGRKLFVWPYQGPLGTLQVTAGKRDVERLIATGSLESTESLIGLTEQAQSEDKTTAGSYRLPVGDYRPTILRIQYDDLRCLILPNRHADGSPGGRSELGPATYGIKIQENKPFVLDLSSEPKVIFASPAKGVRVSLGDQLAVKAVLTDPSLDVMYRQIREKEPLNPTVKIARASGEIVAEGAMPFG